MKKKVLASIIAMTMAAACLTACGDSSKTEDKTSSSKAESSSSAETTTTTTTAATTAPTTTTAQPTTDPNGYAQKLVGVWVKEKTDNDNNFDFIIFTDKEEYHTFIEYSGKAEKYSITDNKLDLATKPKQFITELNDSVLELSSKDPQEKLGRLDNPELYKTK